MRKVIDYLLLSVMVILALLPPWDMFINCDVNSFFWLWGVLASAFLVMWLAAFVNVSAWLKALIVYAFLTCFLSAAPYISFTMFWSLIACAYYYVACLHVENRGIFYKAAQAILFVVSFLIIVQLFGKDTLLNFNMPHPCVLGTIGNKMILGTFVVCLAPLVLQVSPLNLFLLWIIAFVTGSSGTILSVSAGMLAYSWMIGTRAIKWMVAVLFVMMCLAVIVSQHDLNTFKTFGRGPVWKRTIEASVKRPLGYGIATYRLLFPLMSQDIAPTRGANMAQWEYDHTTGHGLAWRRTHNCYLQILFETGFPGLALFLGFCGVALWRIRKAPAALAGFVMVAVNMLVHFPSRTLQAVPALIVFLAFCNARSFSWKA